MVTFSKRNRKNQPFIQFLNTIRVCFKKSTCNKFYRQILKQCMQTKFLLILYDQKNS
jgi:hypothetical protein